VSDELAETEREVRHLVKVAGETHIRADKLVPLMAEYDRLRAVELAAAEHLPRRDDAVATWLKKWRDQRDPRPAHWVLDEMLDLYRLHADTGTPLAQHACEPGDGCEESRR
jgi:hypothetical protein